MKKCPYCDEKIRDAAIKCRYCANFLEPKEKLGLEIIKQKESRAYWFIFIAVLLLYDLLMIILWISMNEGYALFFTIFFLAWDAFFGYFLLKSSKKWPKIFIAIRIIIRILAMIRPVLSQFGFHPLLELLTLLGLTFLLLIKNRGLFKKIKAGFVSLTYCVFIFLTLSLIFQNMQYKNDIQKLPFLSEYVSEKGYKIKLPSVKWRILKEEQASKILGASSKKWDTKLVADNGKLHGLLLGFPLNEEITINKIKEDMKQEISSLGMEYVGEEADNSELFISCKVTEDNKDYFSMYNFKLLRRLGILSYFVGPENDFYKYKNDIKKLISSAEEIPLKTVLKKVSSSEIFKRYSDAVVLVRIYNKKGEIVGYGSGFNLMKEGLVLTNLHVIMEANNFDVKFPNGGVYQEGYIMGLSKKAEDLVLLKIVGNNLPYTDSETASELDIGDKVFVIGNPEGLVNSLSEGIISGIREVSPERRYYQITAPISPGSSGSPVFDEFGRLVGVATFYLEGGQNLNFCIPIDELASLEILENMITLEQFSQILKEDK